MSEVVVSIIMPVFNRQSLIVETLETIKDQTFNNFECIIIDDGSTDETVNIIKKYIVNDNRFVLMLRGANYKKGPAGCRNMGLDLAKGEYIQFFDSDDLMHENHLQMKIGSYTEGVDLVVCRLGEFRGDNPQQLFNINEINDEGKLVSHLSGVANYYLPGPMWKKEIIGNERFDINLKIYEDLLFNLKGRKKCFNVVLLNDVLISYRRHEKSTTGTITQNPILLNQKRLAWQSVFKLFEKNEKREVKKILFGFSSLNFYYLLCNKSLINAGMQFIDMLRYSSSIQEIYISLKLLIFSIVPFITNKGYRIYKVRYES